MELKISNKITRKINREVQNIKWKWNMCSIKYHLWKIKFNINTLPIRIALNPKIIKLKISGKFNPIRHKWRIFKIDFKYFVREIKNKVNKWRRKEKIIMCASVLKATVLSLLVIYLFAFVFDVTLLSIAQCFGLMTNWKII